MYWEFLGEIREAISMELWVREAERESKSRECGPCDALKELIKGKGIKGSVHYHMTHLSVSRGGQKESADV